MHTKFCGHDCLLDRIIRYFSWSRVLLSYLENQPENQENLGIFFSEIEVQRPYRIEQT